MDQKRKIRYYDCLGFSEAVNIYDKMEQILEISDVFIVSGTSLKSCHRSIIILNKLNPGKVNFILTQCDKYKDNELEKQKKKNTDYLQSLKI